MAQVAATLAEALFPRWSHKRVARELAFVRKLRTSLSTARRLRAELSRLTDDELQVLLERRLEELAEAEARINALRSGRW